MDIFIERLQMLKIILFTLILLFFPACGSNSSAVVKHNIDFTKTQKTIADQFISIFENGTTDIQYEYIEDFNDTRGYTAGRAGFTSGTGDMLMVIKEYTIKKPNNSLTPYINELERLFQIYKNNNYELSNESANIENLDGLKEAWIENAKFKLFRDIQDKVVDDIFFYPSVEICDMIGLKMPLSLLVIYDSYVQHGKIGLDKLVKKATDITNNQTPKDGADELTWLKNFVLNRKTVLESNQTVWNGSINRVIELLDLIEAENTQLEPFELIIEYPEDTGYSDEVFNLPVI
jgi:chitosanase